MKCLQDKKTGEIRRVGNKTAEYCVKKQTHVYVPKADWKTTGRKYV